MEYRYLLIVRLALFNIVAFLALFAGYMEGCLAGIFEGATFLMTFGIFLVFLIGLIARGTQFWRTSEELNDLETGMPGPGNTWPNWSCTTARDGRSNRR